MKIVRILFVALIVLAFAAPGQAQTQAPAWKIDPDHTSFTFLIRHILADIPGRFGQFAGTVRFNPEKPGDSVFDVTVKTASIDTAVQKRDDHLRSADFFEVERYPDMRFVSSAITKKSDNAFVAKGSLTIKNVTKDVEVPFVFLGSKDNPMVQGGKVAGFRFDFPVVLADYGVSDGRFTRMGMVGEKAQVTVNIEALR